MKVTVILFMAFVAIVGVFSAPDEGMPLAEWAASFLFTKAVGVQVRHIPSTRRRTEGWNCGCATIPPRHIA